MPFSCIFKLNNGALNAGDKVIFREFIDSAFDKYHSEKVRIARVEINGNSAFISSNCACYVSSKATLENGHTLNEDTTIGYFSAEGEDIPYNRPYAIIVF